MATTVNSRRESLFQPIRQNLIMIGGSFRPSLSGKTFATIDPATEEKICDIAEGDRADIDLAVEAAKKALEGPWKQMDGQERGKLLFKLADLLEENIDEFAYLECIDTGKPYNNARNGDIPHAIETLRYFAGWADKIQGKTLPISGPYATFTRKEPVGVCGWIIPWNYPLSLAIWKLAPALACGCTGVLKPAEQTPLTALRLGNLILEAGIPEGVVNIVPGFGPSAGAALVSHPDVAKIAFTGEGKTAKTIQAGMCDSMKRFTCELGGKSPNIICADADLSQAIPGSIGAIFGNQGQNCCAGSRLFVHESIQEEFLAGFIEAAKALIVSDPFQDSCDLGCLIDQRQMEKVLHYIDLGKKEGAKLILGGKRVGDRGCFVEPTIFTGVKDDMAIAKDEIFGPVASVLSFSSLDEVLERANATPYGLAGAVWTQNMGTAQRVAAELKAGTVWINCYNVVTHSVPFGGFKESGLGRELGEAALDAYLENKSITMAI